MTRVYNRKDQAVPYQDTHGKGLLRDDPKLANIPIIAMTANAFKEDEEAALAVGMQAHIAKPIDLNTMMATIRRVLQENARKGEKIC